MGSLGTNHEGGTIQSASIVNGQTVMVLNTGQMIDSGRYSANVSGGTVSVHGKINFPTKPYDVYSNTATQVVVNEVINPLSKVVGKTFTIYDDDDYDSDNSPDNGDESETSITTLTALDKLQATDSPSTNVYAPAYIMPVYDGGGGAFNGSATGNVNIATTDVATKLNAARGASGSDEFWVGYIQIGYQGALSEDMDPDSELAASVAAYTPANDANSANADCSGMPQGGTGSLIYQETTRDAFASVSAANDNLTAPHELGHQFGLLGDGTAGGPYGIMDGGYNVSNFVPAHLHILRCRVKSPGLL
jgi:hypothetical protein